MSESTQFRTPKPAPTPQGEYLARVEHTLSTATVEGLLRSTARLSSSLDTNQLLDWLLDDALTLLGAESGFVGVRKGAELVSRSFRRQQEALPFERTFPPGHGLPGWLLVNKRPYVTNSAAEDPQIRPELNENFNVWSAMSVPVVDRHEEVIAFVQLHNKLDGRPFDLADQHILMLLAQGAALAIENALTYRSKLQLAAIVDSSDDAIVGKDLRGIITSWNAAASRLFGYAPEEIIGKSVLELIPPELHGEEPEILRKLAGGSKIDHYETRRVRKNGETIYVSLTISPIKDTTGQVIGASKIARDIGERRQADEVRSRLAAIVQSASDAIIGTDLNGVINSWNEAATRLFGYNPEEIIGKSILTLIPPELHSEEYEILARLRAGEPIKHYETERLKKNGERVQVSLTISPVRDANDRVIGSSKIARDISDRKRAEAALIQSEKLAAIGRMSAAIAHEVNNPLEAITNLGYLLSTHPSLDAEAQRYANMLLDEVSRASQISRQVLSFYKDTANPVNVEIPEVLDSVLELCTPAIRKKAIRIEREYRGPASAWGHAAEFRQVFANLLLNAIDALRVRGQIKIRVGPRLGRDGQSPEVVRITIADNGTGIPPEAMRKIFEPFFTSKQGKGSGLGLWVSQGIIRKHGGSIRVRSSTNSDRSGTVFRILLPMRAAAV